MAERNYLSKVWLVFAALDALSFVRYFGFLALPFKAPLEHGLLYVAVDSLQALLVGTFAISCLGFFAKRSWAIGLYFLQFPLRVLFMSFSFGFLTYLNYGLGSTAFYYTLLAIAAGLEVVRLVLAFKLYQSARS